MKFGRLGAWKFEGLGVSKAQGYQTWSFRLDLGYSRGRLHCALRAVLLRFVVFPSVLLVSRGATLQFEMWLPVICWWSAADLPILAAAFLGTSRVTRIFFMEA